MGTATISVDEFQALEAKVLQAVEIIRRERDARATAEAERDAAVNERDQARGELEQSRNEAAELRGQIDAHNNHSQSELEALQREREATRLRVEKMLSQMDELL